MRRVAVAIPHAGDAENLERCLDALEHDREVAEVVVVLPEAAATSRVLIDHHPRCVAIVTPDLEPFAIATNRAVAASAAPYVLLLNDDAVVQPGAAQRLATYLAAHPEAGAAAPKLLNRDGTFQPSLYRDPSAWSALEELARPLLHGRIAGRVARNPQPSFPQEPTSVHWAAAAALLVRRTVFDQVGGLDERYPHGMEDAAFCLELRRAGFKVIAFPGAEVIHLKGASGFRHSDRNRMARTLSHGVTSWVLYMRRYHPRSAIFVQVIFLLHAVMRYFWFATFGRLRDPSGAAIRSYAYRRHLGTLARRKH